MLALVLSCVLATDVRTWTDSSGAYKVEASFEGFQDGTVRLTKADGKKSSVPYARLSQADRVWVWNAVTGKADAGVKDYLTKTRAFLDGVQSACKLLDTSPTFDEFLAKQKAVADLYSQIPDPPAGMEKAHQACAAAVKKLKGVSASLAMRAKAFASRAAKNEATRDQVNKLADEAAEVGRKLAREASEAVVVIEEEILAAVK